ncbi:hypothetical protein LPJ63_002908 [Coemansia sp. RSA 2711]|nr:hypothetical protein LPJ63_002908 [Coemansia sp. RSA 2711]
MWRTGARLLAQHTARHRLAFCAQSSFAPGSRLGAASSRSFRTTHHFHKDSTLDKERQRQQAQDDMSEELEEHKRDRRLAEDGSAADTDLAPEVERLDPQSVPGLYPEFDTEEQEGDDSWYVDPRFAQQESIPLWKQRAAENLGQPKDAEEILLSGSMFDLCHATLQEDAQVAVLDVRDRCEWTERMLVAQANSTRHMRAMGERLLKLIKERHRRTDRTTAIRVDGRESDDWMVVDMGAFIVHIMTPDAHRTYDLEALWTAPLPEPEVLSSIEPEQSPDK